MLEQIQSRNIIYNRMNDIFKSIHLGLNYKEKNIIVTLTNYVDHRMIFDFMQENIKMEYNQIITTKKYFKFATSYRQ